MADENDYSAGRIGFGVLLTLAFLFLVMSLFSWSPLDPPGNMVHTQAPVQVQNLCGKPGAVTAAFLVRFCGLGAWFLLIPIFFRVVSYWRLRKLSSSVTKTCGTLLMLIAFSGLVSIFLPQFIHFLKNTEVESEQIQQFLPKMANWLASSETELGSGGQLGAFTFYILHQKLNIASSGIAVFLIFIFTAGIILAGDSRILNSLLQITGILPLAEVFADFLHIPHKPKDVIFPIKTPPHTGASAQDSVFSVVTVTDTPAFSEEVLTSDPIPEYKPAAEKKPKFSLFHPFGKKKDNVQPVPVPAAADVTPPEAETNKADEKPDKNAEEPAPLPPSVKETAPSQEPPLPEREIYKPYTLPPIDILPHANPLDRTNYAAKIEAEGKRLQRAFEDYNCAVQVVDYQSGPVITLFELELSKGLKLVQIQSLTNDLAIAMKVPSVRIVAPIPGKNSVGVEIPNKDRQFVRLRDVMEEGEKQAANMEIPLFIGKDVTGDPIIADLSKLPHLLIAGRTGTGKSVCLNSIILSILMTKTPEEVRLILIDPKMVELSPYKQIPHLMHPVVTDMKKAAAVLAWLVEKMDERYNLLARVGVRQLKEYNKLSPERLYQRYQPETEEEWKHVPKKIPAIVVIADEMADMMAVAGKDIQEYIARLAQKSRAIGIYLILATQKPTVDVVTGLIKSNLPARIAFGVATQSDSRVILDINGAEKLLGNGDLLFLNSVTNQIIRGQGTYIDEDEIFSVNCEISVDEPDFVFVIDTENDGDRQLRRQKNDDPLYESAVEMVLTERRGSTSFLQRRFSIGYGRAAKIIDAMEAEGILGPKSNNDSKAREVLITMEEWLSLKNPETEIKPEPARPSSYVSSSEFRQESVRSYIPEQDEKDKDDYSGGEYPDEEEYQDGEEDDGESGESSGWDGDEEEDWLEEETEEETREESDSKNTEPVRPAVPDTPPPALSAGTPISERFSSSEAQPAGSAEPQKRSVPASRPHPNLREMAKQRRLKKNRGRKRK